MNSSEKRSYAILVKQAIIFNRADGIDLAKRIIAEKIANQYHLLVHASTRLDHDLRDEVRNPLLLVLSADVLSVRTKQQILLIEARAARYYWKSLSALVKTKVLFIHRNQHDTPFVKLLNIGYHHLGIIVRQSLLQAGLDPSIGFFHEFHHYNKPLVYDLMELFRQPVVDRALLKFIRQRKTPLHEVDSVTIARFIKQIQSRLDEKTIHGESAKELIEMESVLLRRYVMGQRAGYHPHCWKWGHQKKKKTHQPLPA